MHEDIQAEAFLKKFKPAKRPATCDKYVEELLQQEGGVATAPGKPTAPARFWALWTTLAACALAAVLWGMSDSRWKNALDQALSTETAPSGNSPAAPGNNTARVCDLEMYFWGSEEVEIDGRWIWAARLYVTVDGGARWQTIDIPKPHDTHSDLADQPLTSIKCCFEDKTGDIYFLGWLVTDTGKRRGKQKLDSVFYKLDMPSMKLEVCGRSPEGKQLERFLCTETAIMLADTNNAQRHYSGDHGKTWSTQPTDCTQWDNFGNVYLTTSQAWGQYELVLMEEELRKKREVAFEEFSKEWQMVECFSNGITLYRSQTSQTPTYRLGNAVSAQKPEISWKGGEIKLPADKGERTLKTEFSFAADREKDLNPGPKNRQRMPGRVLALSFSAGEMEGAGSAALLTSVDDGETWQSQKIAGEKQNPPELYDTGIMMPGYVDFAGHREAALRRNLYDKARTLEIETITQNIQVQDARLIQDKCAALEEQLAALKTDPDKNQEQIIMLTAELERLRSELSKYNHDQR